MNGLNNNSDKTDKEYSLACTDDLMEDKGALHLGSSMWWQSPFFSFIGWMFFMLTIQIIDASRAK